MVRSMRDHDRTEAVVCATAPAVWLLETGLEGVPLTEKFALSRMVVREAAERWPAWWHAELFGQPHREADVAVVGALREGLLRLKLLRRRGRKLLTTPAGRELLADRETLLRTLAGDLGGGDPFGEVVAGAALTELSGGAPVAYDRLTQVALKEALRQGWRGPDHAPPPPGAISWEISGLLRRGAAYGLIEWADAPDTPRRLRRHELLITEGARVMMDLGAPRSAGMPVYVFAAELTNAPGVSARVAVRADQHLTALHDAIQEAFGWSDDHLYSFWLDGEFWGAAEHEFTSPDVPDEAPNTADIPLVELALSPQATIAYVFDFGDEWRVHLELQGQQEPAVGAYPRVLDRVGTAPPQY